jgi:hypothetical protein
MIVIGSTALAYYEEGITPNDLDLVGTYDEAVAFKKVFQATSFYPINHGKSIFMRNAAGKICEVEVAWPDSRAEKFIQFIETVDRAHLEVVELEGYGGYEVDLPNLQVLLLLKMSHRYLKDSPHFLKTMKDIWHLRAMGAEILEGHKAFYEQRMKDTYTYAHPKLNVSKDGFFDAVATGVEYTYDHDSIHEAVKHMKKPAYSYFKEDESEVMVSRELFDKQPHMIKIYSVLEEAYVLAIERSLVPYPGGMTPEEAFKMALMKVCTSITSGWWREFAWEHYYLVERVYNDTFFKKFQAALDAGIVKPFK